MSLRAIDLNLLAIFDAIYKTRNLTRASERIGLSQPAVSHALTRLRETFGDQLFLRDGRAMEPTARAHRLGVAIESVLNDVDGMLRDDAVFDPSGSQREFNLVLSDYGELLILPALMRRLQDLDTQLRINVRAQHFGEVRDAMQFGKVDFYLWAVPVRDSGFRCEPVATDTLSCIVRRGHPLLDAPVTLKRYMHARHIGIGWPSWHGARPIDQFLHSKGLAREIDTTVHSYFDVPRVVAVTDLVSTMPTRMACEIAAQHGLVAFEAPLAGLNIAMYLMWHSRLDGDPAHRWMGGLLKELIAAGAVGAVKPSRRRAAPAV
jgi:DNA-binding transcriptional LysR family regulator